MATAKKLPSGSWRCQVYSHTEETIQPDGTIKKKRIYKSFTCDDPSAKGRRKCEAEAAAWAVKKETLSKNISLTLGEAIDAYIASRANVLSPRTITSYKSIRKTYVQSLMERKLDDLKQEDIQKAVNLEALKYSPKTIRNIHGLLSAVLKVYRPEFALYTALPKRKRPELYIPADDDVKRLLEAVRGTELELPILLAAFGPMRRGEICALTSDNIDGNIVHVCQNMVKDENKKWVIKTPKSYAGDRYIDYPDFVAEKWNGIEGRIVTIHPDNITSKFGRTLKRLGLPHFRFHDLRHYSASIQHALGIPDVYIMQRGGWRNDSTLKSVYRHAMNDRQKEMAGIANNYFSELCNTKCNTK